AREWRARSQVRVKRRYSRVKSLDVRVPRLRGRVLPALVALRERKPPVEQVPDVRKDLARRARRWPGLKAGKLRRRIPHGFAAAVGDGGERVSKEGLHRVLRG